MTLHMHYAPPVLALVDIVPLDRNVVHARNVIRNERGRAVGGSKRAIPSRGSESSSAMIKVKQEKCCKG